MINLLYISIIAIFFAIIFVITEFHLFSKFWSRFFPQSDGLGTWITRYICPNCGSTNWKFPDPLKPAGNMINIYHMVNLYYQCRDCGYIGIFFQVNKDDIKTIKFEGKKDQVINLKRF